MTMNRRSFAITCGTLLANACGRRTPQPMSSTTGRRSMRADLTFVTRDGCVNTPDMLLNVDVH